MTLAGGFFFGLWGVVLVWLCHVLVGVFLFRRDLGRLKEENCSFGSGFPPIFAFFRAKKRLFEELLDLDPANCGNDRICFGKRKKKSLGEKCVRQSRTTLVFHPLINSTFWWAMYQQLFLLTHQCHQDCISNGTQSVLHLFLQNICRYDS